MNGRRWAALAVTVAAVLITAAAAVAVAGGCILGRGGGCGRPAPVVVFTPVLTISPPAPAPAAPPWPAWPSAAPGGR